VPVLSVVVDRFNVVEEGVAPKDPLGDQVKGDARSPVNCLADQEGHVSSGHCASKQPVVVGNE